MNTADTSKLSKLLLVGVASATLAIGASAAVSASTGTTEPADDMTAHTEAEHTMDTRRAPGVARRRRLSRCELTGGRDVLRCGDRGGGGGQQRGRGGHRSGGRGCHRRRAERRRAGRGGHRRTVAEPRLSRVRRGLRVADRLDEGQLRLRRGERHGVGVRVRGRASRTYRPGRRSSASRTPANRSTSSSPCESTTTSHSRWTSCSALPEEEAKRWPRRPPSPSRSPGRLATARRRSHARSLRRPLLPAPRAQRRRC